MKAKGKTPRQVLGYKAWKAAAADVLADKHDIKATLIPESKWREFFIVAQSSPEEAAAAAEVHYSNFIRRPAWAPRKR